MNLRLLGRHQLAAAAATLVDFTMMIATVELGVAGPVIATGIGAASGAFTNFTVSRHWAFTGAASGAADRQAVRYLLVSAGSLALNVVGVFALQGRAPYPLARVAVAILVSLVWNFPLHRHFVFAEARA